jgi:hypothetical protein
VSALPYDGTNPFSTTCWQTNHTVYTLGEQSPINHGDEGDPTEILYNGILIGTVEIRHSRYCATVWSQVHNYTGTTVSVKEALVTYSDSNGAGRVEHWYPTTDTVGPGGNGWSNQYRDRASFSAKGGIYYAGAWRYAETPRSVAWVQRTANFYNTPYACNHSQLFPCKRWPTLPNGLSVTLHYYIASNVHSMPKAGGGTVDESGDVTFMFDQFNAVAAANPFLYAGTQSQSEVQVYAYYEDGIAARGGGTDQNGDGYYETGVLKLSTAGTWHGDGSERGSLCHETDHLMGLDHIWWSNSAGISNVGSKASCLGMGNNGGPMIDDVSALNDVYTGVAP